MADVAIISTSQQLADMDGNTTQGDDEQIVVEVKQTFDYAEVKLQKIGERLEAAAKCIMDMDYEGALIEFNKVLFYNKEMPNVYAEKAEIYIKLCDFSSAI